MIRVAAPLFTINQLPNKTKSRRTQHATATVILFFDDLMTVSERYSILFENIVFLISACNDCDHYISDHQHSADQKHTTHPAFVSFLHLDRPLL